MQEVNQPGDTNPGRSGQRPRQSAHKLQEDPRQRVFESIAQGWLTVAKENFGVKR